VGNGDIERTFTIPIEKQLQRAVETTGVSVRFVEKIKK
jgi:hypothetical protein